MVSDIHSWYPGCYFSTLPLSPSPAGRQEGVLSGPQAHRLSAPHNIFTTSSKSPGKTPWEWQRETFWPVADWLNLSSNCCGGTHNLSNTPFHWYSSGHFRSHRLQQTQNDYNSMPYALSNSWYWAHYQCGSGVHLYPNAFPIWQPKIIWQLPSISSSFSIIPHHPSLHRVVE